MLVGMCSRMLFPVLVSCALGLFGCQAPSTRLSVPEVTAQEAWALDDPLAADLTQAGAGWALTLASPELEADIRAAMDIAPRVRASIQRFAAQIAEVDQAAAQRLPEVVLGANAARVRSEREWAADYRLNTALSWELDLFGRLGAEGEAATAAKDMAAADLAGLRLSQAATLVAAWLDATHAAEQIILHEALHEVLDQEIVAWANHLADSGDPLARLALVDRRGEAAMVSDDLVLWRQRLAGAMAAYAVILGRAETVEVPLSERLPAPPALVGDLPTAVLTRRPDVARVRAEVQRAIAKADVAWAERWPVLNLGAEVGYQGTRIDRLVTPQNLVTQVLGGLLAPLFDGGRRRAAQAVAEAQVEAVAETYRQTIAEVWQETRAALVSALISAQGDHQAHERLRLASARGEQVDGDWHAGLVPTTDRLAVRRLALEVQLVASGARHRAWSDWLAVQRALALPPLLTSAVVAAPVVHSAPEINP